MPRVQFQLDEMHPQMLTVWTELDHIWHVSMFRNRVWIFPAVPYIGGDMARLNCKLHTKRVLRSNASPKCEYAFEDVSGLVSITSETSIIGKS